MPSDAAQSPGCALLHRAVKLFQTRDQCVHSPAAHHSLRQLRRVFGHRAQYERRLLHVEPLQANRPVRWSDVCWCLVIYIAASMLCEHLALWPTNNFGFSLPLSFPIFSQSIFLFPPLVLYLSLSVLSFHFLSYCFSLIHFLDLFLPSALFFFQSRSLSFLCLAFSLFTSPSLSFVPVHTSRVWAH